jgi:hypothetical protein
MNANKFAEPTGQETEIISIAMDSARASRALLFFYLDNQVEVYGGHCDYGFDCGTRLNSIGQINQSRWEWKKEGEEEEEEEEANH